LASGEISVERRKRDPALRRDGRYERQKRKDYCGNNEQGAQHASKVIEAMRRMFA